MAMATKMELIGVRVQMPTNAPVMLLRESTGEHRLLPIFIGGPEAQSIDMALEEVSPPRPMTHDLFVAALASFGVELTQVVITEVKGGTFFAEMTLDRGADGVITLSARPSDAVALASRVGAPIFADEALIDDVGIEETDDSGSDDGEEAMVEELRRFLDSATPEDFTGDDS